MVFSGVVKSEGVKLPFIVAIEWATNSNTSLLEEDLQLIHIMGTLLTNLNLFEFDLPWFSPLEKTLSVFSQLSQGTILLVSTWVSLILSLYSVGIHCALNSDPCSQKCVPMIMRGAGPERISGATQIHPHFQKNCSKDMPHMEEISQIFCQERPVF